MKLGIMQPYFFPYLGYENGYDFDIALIPKDRCCSKTRRSYYFGSRSISLKHEPTKINGFIKI